MSPGAFLSDFLSVTLTVPLSQSAQAAGTNTTDWGTQTTDVYFLSLKG